MNPPSLFPKLRIDITDLPALDVVVVIGLMLVALAVFYVTPEFAANLPQDAGDFAIPSVNLLERGRLVGMAYGHEFPPLHPPGLALLLTPAYVIFGHNLGNGIYIVLACALATIALTYGVGVKLGGRFCGIVAALFLITHYGFWQYSQKIMSEVPSTTIALATLALLLRIRDGREERLTYVAIGALLGFGIIVRYDNLLLLAPAILLILWDDDWHVRASRLALCLATMAPFVIGLAAYDQVAFGSPWRTSYHYWGASTDPERPTFTFANASKSGFLRQHGIHEPIPGLVEGNGTFYAKSLLTESDTTRIFGHPLYWQSAGRPIYQTLALGRTALGVIGFLACLMAWRTNFLRRRFLLWLVTATVVYVGLYIVYFWQEERFLLRLVPGFCLLNGVGFALLLDHWRAPIIRTTVLASVVAGIGGFAVFNWQMGFPSGNDSHLYETLTGVARQIESNAVVVSNFESQRLNSYVIQGTQRMAVPLSPDSGLVVFVGHDAKPTILHPFVAVESPDRLREIVDSGRPVYWLINNPWSGRPTSALEALERSFRLQVLATVNFNGGVDQPYFGRVRDLQ
jgi:4-amino-4-deoxy-L-arabinose transferase-like glycosyltransferase